MSGFEQSSGQFRRESAKIAPARLHAIDVFCAAMVAGLVMFGVGLTVLEGFNLGTPDVLKYAFASVPIIAIVLSFILPDTVASSVLAQLETMDTIANRSLRRVTVGFPSTDARSPRSVGTRSVGSRSFSGAVWKHLNRSWSALYHCSGCSRPDVAAFAHRVQRRPTAAEKLELHQFGL